MSSPTRDASTSDRMHSIIRAAWISVAAIAAVLALGVLVAQVTASPRLCGSCHQMKPKVETWETSAHTQVGCPACHEEPRPWYQFPQTLAIRGVMLERDLDAHLFGDESAALASDVTSETIPDSRCLKCHDPAREVSMRYGTLIDHDEHAERNGSCVSCHMWTAHPDPEAERSLLLMQQCFTCHGRGEDALAPGTCDACHPPEFEQRPETHRPSGWESNHGELAKPDLDYCAMCHDQDFCLDCHGIEMPHPAQWEDGATSHGPVAAQNREVCVNCHPREPDFCSMCHHEGFEPRKGPWVDQHPDLVVERGASFCIDCHDPLFCYDCHTIGRVEAGIEPEAGPDSN